MPQFPKFFLNFPPNIHYRSLSKNNTHKFEAGVFSLMLVLVFFSSSPSPISLTVHSAEASNDSVIIPQPPATNQPTTFDDSSLSAQHFQFPCKCTF